MLQQIARFSVHRTAKVLAILYALLGLLFVPLIWLGSIADPEGAMPISFTLIFPLIYGLFGYVFTALACALYNVIAARVGGIEFSLTPSSDAEALSDG